MEPTPDPFPDPGPRAARRRFGVRKATLRCRKGDGFAAENVGIQYTDLDLSTKAGQDQLERRIDGAAREACGMDKVVTGRFTPSTAQRRCYRDTKASVGEQVAQMIARETPRG